MKFGVRKPSLKKMISARTSPSRLVRHSFGIKAPRGGGWLTNPKRAAYNRVYSRTTFSIWSVIKALFGGEAIAGGATVTLWRFVRETI